LTSRDFAKNCLFYCAELVLDAGTPGAVAKERLVRNAKLLREACEVWCEAMKWPVEGLMKEVWADQKAREARGTGTNTVAGHPSKPAGLSSPTQPLRTVKPIPSRVGVGRTAKTRTP